MFWPCSVTASPLVQALIETVTKDVKPVNEVVVQIPRAKAFSDAMRSAGKREWPSRKTSITPYCMRHQAAADMKADEGMSSGDISAALGHCSDVTKSTYGHANMGRSGGVAPARVEAALAVKTKKPAANAKAMTAKIKKSGQITPKTKI